MGPLRLGFGVLCGRITRQLWQHWLLVDCVIKTWPWGGLQECGKRPETPLGDVDRKVIHAWLNWLAVWNLNSSSSIRVCECGDRWLYSARQIGDAPG